MPRFLLIQKISFTLIVSKIFVPFEFKYNQIKIHRLVSTNIVSVLSYGLKSQVKDIQLNVKCQQSVSMLSLD